MAAKKMPAKKVAAKKAMSDSDARKKIAKDINSMVASGNAMKDYPTAKSLINVLPDTIGEGSLRPKLGDKKFYAIANAEGFSGMAIDGRRRWQISSPRSNRSKRFFYSCNGSMDRKFPECVLEIHPRVSTHLQNTAACPTPSTDSSAEPFVSPAIAN